MGTPLFTKESALRRASAHGVPLAPDVPPGHPSAYMHAPGHPAAPYPPAPYGYYPMHAPPPFHYGVQPGAGFHGPMHADTAAAEHGEHGGVLAPPAGGTLLRKRTREDVRKDARDDARLSSPSDDDGPDMSLDEFCNMFGLADILKDGLKTLQFVPGLKPSSFSREDWEGAGIQKGGWLQVEKADQKYRRYIKKQKVERE
jgi:hypothetical protein